MTSLLSTRDVASLLGMSEDFVRDHARELGAIRLGGRRGQLRFEEARIREFLDRQRLRAREVTRSQSRRRPGPHRAAGVELLPLPEDA